MKARLQQYYQDKVVDKLKKELKIDSYLAVPKLEKIIVSVGVGQATKDKNLIKINTSFLEKITGQKPVVTKAHRSIAGFSLRQGQVIGLKVTLRKEKMWSFLDKLINIVLPLVRDFQGVPQSAFDQSGNYHIGLAEQVIFPEVDYDDIDKRRGVRISIITSTNQIKASKRLLELLGMPFRKVKS